MKSKLGSFFSITPTIGGYNFAPEDSLKSAPTFGLRVGWEKVGPGITSTLGVEASANYITTKNKADNTSAKAYLFRGDLVYSLGSKTWVPYIALGTGAILSSTETHSKSEPLFDYALGLKYFLTDYLALRAEFRQIFVYRSISTSNNFELSSGVTYIFGKERPKPAPAKKAEETKIKKKADDLAPIQLDLPQEVTVLQMLGATGLSAVGIGEEPPPYKPSTLPPRNPLLRKPYAFIGAKPPVQAAPAAKPAVPPTKAPAAVPPVPPGAAVPPAPVPPLTAPGAPAPAVPAPGSAVPGAAVPAVPVPGAAVPAVPVVPAVPAAPRVPAPAQTPGPASKAPSAAVPAAKAAVPAVPGASGAPAKMPSAANARAVTAPAVAAATTPAPPAAVPPPPAAPAVTEAGLAAPPATARIVASPVWVDPSEPAPAAASAAAPKPAAAAPAPVAVTPAATALAKAVGVPSSLTPGASEFAAPAVPSPAPGASVVIAPVAKVPQRTPPAPPVAADYASPPAAPTSAAKAVAAPPTPPVPAPAAPALVPAPSAPVVAAAAPAPAPPAPADAAPVPVPAPSAPASEEPKEDASLMADNASGIEPESAFEPAGQAAPAMAAPTAKAAAPEVAAAPAPEEVLETAVKAQAPEPQPAPGRQPTAAKASALKVSKNLRQFIIEFDFNRAQVRPQYDQQLKNAAELIKRAKNPTVRIEGHTDKVGGPITNQKLSLKRANRVKERLVRLGVDPKQIQTVGFGFRQPISTNDTPQGRQKNRRAETIITVVIEP